MQIMGNTTVTPEMSPLRTLHKTRSYRRLQLISSMLRPGYWLKTALDRFYLHAGQWGFRSSKSPNASICPFRVSPGHNDYYFRKVRDTYWGAVNTLRVPLCRYHPWFADIWRSRDTTPFLSAHEMIKQEKNNQVKPQPYFHCHLHDLFNF